MIELVVGLPGQGKSLFSARTVLQLLDRNKRWFEKTGIKRQIASNMPFNEDAVAAALKWESIDGWFRYWTSLEEVIVLPDVDVVFDEVANKFDARNWLNLPENVKWWLRHHDKDGIEIYANTQHYEAVDVQFRRLVNRLLVVQKLVGSRRPAATRPPIKRVWGVCAIRQHDPRLYTFNADNAQAEEVKSAMGWPSLFWISRELVSVYDTRHKIHGDSETTLRHVSKRCPQCGTTKTVHV